MVSYMPKISLKVKFEPEKLKANSKNEAFAILKVSNNESKPLWCESVVSVKLPLSLAHDKESKTGFTRIGIVGPGKHMEKKIRIFTRPNNYPDKYGMSITLYAYDEQGVIAERLEKQESIECV